MADDEKISSSGVAFKFRLLQNPNYFGNLTDLKLPDLPDPVLQIVGNTTYEELTCVGYNPDTDILTAIVRVKLGSGYSGGPCTDGSREYVRFYLDYGPGGWVDHGVASFEIHDLGFEQPLCYAVSIKLGPKMRTCCDKKPVLPVVRAILSWAVEPPAGMPDWPPVWGNRLERAIQIDPRSPFLCRFLDHFTTEGVQKIDPVLYAQIKAAMEAMPAAAKPAATLSELQAEPNDDKLHALRHVFPAVVKLAAGNSDLAAWQVLKDAGIDLAPFDDFILAPKFNTTYEELHLRRPRPRPEPPARHRAGEAPVRLLRRALHRRQPRVHRLLPRFRRRLGIPGHDQRGRPRRARPARRALVPGLASGQPRRAPDEMVRDRPRPHPRHPLLGDAAGAEPAGVHPALGRPRGLLDRDPPVAGRRRARRARSSRPSATCRSPRSPPPATPTVRQHRSRPSPPTTARSAARS